MRNDEALSNDFSIEETDIFKEPHELSIKEAVDKLMSGSDYVFCNNKAYSFFEILRYIKENKLDYKVFRKKWYDLLSGKFYAKEYYFDETDHLQARIATFDNFDDFFKNMHGFIYNDSYFYGYQFSDEEISKYNLDLSLLQAHTRSERNKPLFSEKYAKLVDGISISKAIKKRKKIFDYFKRRERILSLEILLDQKERFREQFENIGCNIDLNDLFYFLLIRDRKDEVKDLLIEYAKNKGFAEGPHLEYWDRKDRDYVHSSLSLGNLLINYGKETILEILKDFAGGYSEEACPAVVNWINEIVDEYEKGMLFSSIKAGFDHDSQIYYSIRTFYKNSEPVMQYSNYFETFEEFARGMNGDLSGCDLLNAPLSVNELDGYKTDRFTKFPNKEKEYRYESSKIYDGKHFIFKENWRDQNDNIILRNEINFDTFAEFGAYLDGDFSNSDFYLCDGIENLKNISNVKLDGIKVRKDVASKLNLDSEKMNESEIQTNEFLPVISNEEASINALLNKHEEDANEYESISYIADIHLQSRFKENNCQTEIDKGNVIREIAKTICEQSTSSNIICGDTSDNFKTFEEFIDCISNYNNKRNDIFNKRNDFFFVLGNHELWDFKDSKLDSVIEKYAKALQKNRMHLLQNNLFYLANINPGAQHWVEITEKELENISIEQLKSVTRCAKCILFGGIGFAGKNESFNANNRIYLDVIDREEEIRESEKFSFLYTKVVNALKGSNNLIIATHMSLKDWGGNSLKHQDGIIYIHGHDHNNYYFDDGKKRIYADNQIGYKGKEICLKQIPFDYQFDWFKDYQDGIYEISKEDYLMFNRGTNIKISFHSKFIKLYMLKRGKTYMFFRLNSKKRLEILSGGLTMSTHKHGLKYFYDRMLNYSNSIKNYLSQYDAFQKQLSSEIKKIGGLGIIHGCIIDIDFFNHLYVNPLDGRVSFYNAKTIFDKYFYPSIGSLLKSQCPSLYDNYRKLIGGNSLAILEEEKEVLTDEVIHNTSTEMYKYSRLIKNLQYLNNCNVIRSWNDDIASDVSEDNGKALIEELISLE